MGALWIADWAELQALAREWAQLCNRASACSPFARPEWLLPWWDVFGEGRPVRVLAIERDGQLAAVLPCTEAASEQGPALALMGGSISDHHDGPLDPRLDGAGEVRAAAARALADGDWRAVTFDRLREDGWLRAVARSEPSGWLGGGETVEDPPCPTLVARPEAYTLADVLPEGFAYRLGRARRKAERAGGLALRPAESGAEALFMFDALSAFHAARWRARGETGVLADASVQRFHRQAIPGLHQAGVLRMFGLSLAGGLAAVVYAFSAHGRLSFYLSGFDPAHESASAGALAVAGAIEHELQAGVRVFDFLRGREPYKYRFGARDAACFTVRLARTDRVDGAGLCPAESSREGPGTLSGCPE